VAEHHYQPESDQQVGYCELLESRRNSTNNICSRLAL
jgi:hypothetical protein